MRLVLPKTKKKEFKGEKEFTKYFFSFKVACMDGDVIPVKECLLEMIAYYGNHTKALCIFVSMWPAEYEEKAYYIFERYLKEEKGFNLGPWKRTEMYHKDEPTETDKEIKRIENEINSTPPHLRRGKKT